MGGKGFGGRYKGRHQILDDTNIDKVSFTGDEWTGGYLKGVYLKVINNNFESDYFHISSVKTYTKYRLATLLKLFCIHPIICMLFYYWRWP